MSSEESDVEMSSTLPLKNKNKPKSIQSPTTAELLKHPDVPKKGKPVAKSPKTEVLKSQESKKLSTKEMVHNALSESKSRKGISLYAIKKYMQDTYSVDVEKVNHLIKKHIKESVESGAIIQTKGIGASGSFRLAPGVKQAKNKTKKPKKTKETTENDENIEKPTKITAKKTSKDAESKKKVAKTVAIDETKVTKDKDTKKSKIVKEKTKSAKTKLPAIKENVLKSPEPGTSRMKTPKKRKNNMMKRKSIGSIIKPPKMKPSAN